MIPEKKTGIASQNQGFSLVEVLVALLILSIGLLGLAALQTTSLQYNTGSYHRTQATYLAYDIIDRMRANSAAVADSDGNGYDQPASANVTAGTNCDTTDCTSAQLALYDVKRWYDRIVATLPDAVARPPTIQISTTKKVTVTIRWMESDLQKLQTWEVQL
ncbi:type IV pilus modification protein PilV [Sulfuricaulis limicola]|uniref:Type IV pilus modification protein PilV n=1 Tax=Sulfuricaulis limicola TaxID=1620215 RepID=A0A1B4XEL6_9GAMM|nr:type IV pilus modification protein PilV [Sulfuricaulis limicola]BAV33247.1 type IV pilus modification protein PilV [Sulfuricaulis limicola]